MTLAASPSALRVSEQAIRILGDAGAGCTRLSRTLGEIRAGR
jgi:hypothetical protein